MNIRTLRTRKNERAKRRSRRYLPWGMAWADRYFEAAEKKLASAIEHELLYGVVAPGHPQGLGALLAPRHTGWPRDLSFPAYSEHIGRLSPGVLDT